MLLTYGRDKKEYLKVILGTQLIYKLETEGCWNCYTPKLQVYEVPRLLRLFVQIGAMLAYTVLDEKSLVLLLNSPHDFISSTWCRILQLFKCLCLGSGSYWVPSESHERNMLSHIHAWISCTNDVLWRLLLCNRVAVFLLVLNKK